MRLADSIERLQANQLVRHSAISWKLRLVAGVVALVAASYASWRVWLCQEEHHAKWRRSRAMTRKVEAEARKIEVETQIMEKTQEVSGMDEND